MFVVILFSVVALVLTILESKHYMRHGMKIGFYLVTFLAAIHYNYGNDYMAYYNIYNEIVSIPFNLRSVLSGDVYQDPGWALICYTFKHLGGFFMQVIVLNIIQNVLVYKFIRREVQQSWWPMAVFIYLFSTPFYLYSFSMMRQSLVVFVFLGLWPWIKQKRVIPTLLVLLFCSSIHSSAIILLPFAFIGFFSMNRTKLWAIIYIVLFLLLWLSKDFLDLVFQSFLMVEEFETYAEMYSDTQNDVTYGIGFIMNLLPFILTIYILLIKDQFQHYDVQLISIAILSFMVTPFGQIVPLVGRVGIYFEVFRLAAVPIVYSSIKNPISRVGFLSILIVMYLHGYISFFSSPIWRDAYTEFHTIFSVIF